MPPLRLLVVPAATAALAFAAGYQFRGTPALPPSRERAPAEDWRSALLRSGYVELPITLDSTRMPQVEVEANGQKLLLLLDTGSPTHLFDRHSVERLDLTLRPSPRPISVGGALDLPAQIGTVPEITFGGYRWGPLEIYVADLARMIEMQVKAGDRRPDGVLGTPFLARYLGVLDYAKQRLYLMPDPPAAHLNDPRQQK